MIEKTLIDTMLSKIQVGAVRVVYWDDDVRLYGTGEPYFTMQFKSAAVVRSMLVNLTLGFGEGYMNGLIEIDGPLSNIGRLVSENQAAFGGVQLPSFTRHLHRNIKSKQQHYIQHHYDLGNDFYKLWLDTSLTYSCAYFRTAHDTLETAQKQKVQLILRKLQLQKGQRMLDIGSGWGTLLITAAKQYNVTGLGITLSKEQLKRSRQAAKEAGVDKKIQFELCNYQDLATRGETFDRIVSVGMFEHVGRGNHRHYYDAVVRMLADGGVSVLHTITAETEKPTDPWIDKYIFPGGYLPSVREVVSALPKYDLRLLDYENLRLHYAMTLEEWQRRFHMHRPAVIKKYDERFYRMWDLWLASSAASFRYGDVNLSQFVLSKGVNNDLPLTREFLYK
jgi:cyclopropane-fatty-acyl-phospholipid synthase